LISSYLNNLGESECYNLFPWWKSCRISIFKRLSQLLVLLSLTVHALFWITSAAHFAQSMKLIYILNSASRQQRENCFKLSK
jgi:hypothetical protein